MAKPPFPVKYKVSSFEWFSLFSVSIPLWLAEALLSLTVVGEVASEPMGFVQAAIGFYVFLRVSNAKNIVKKLIWLVGSDAVDVIPFINDIPSGPIDIWAMRKTSRKEDEEAAAALAAQAAANENELYDKQLRHDELVQQIQAANDDAASQSRAA